MVRWVVFNDDLERIEHGHAARRGLVELVADAVFEERDVDVVAAAGDACFGPEAADGFGWAAQAAQAAQGVEPGIVPARHPLLLDELPDVALGQNRVRDVAAGEFDLARGEDAELLDEPIVQGAIVDEFVRAQRVRNALNGVALAVGPVVERVDAPSVAGAVMGGVHDAVQDWIAQVDVGRGHVDFGTQHAAAIGERAGLHKLKKVEVLLDGAVAVRAIFARLGERAAVFPDRVRSLVIYVCQALFDEHDSPVVELVKVIGSVVWPRPPVVAEPANVLLHGIHVFLLFARGVGVVVAEVALASVVGGNAEVDRDGLDAADVQVCVWLGWEAGNDLVVAAAFEIGVNGFADEVAVFVCAHGSSVAGCAWQIIGQTVPTATFTRPCAPTRSSAKGGLAA